MACCPVCKSEGAYVGAREVECASVQCKYFSQRQRTEWLATQPVAVKEVLDSEDPVDHPTPSWHWVTQHHDFGD